MEDSATSQSVRIRAPITKIHINFFRQEAGGVITLVTNFNTFLFSKCVPNHVKTI